MPPKRSPPRGRRDPDSLRVEPLDAHAQAALESLVRALAGLDLVTVTTAATLEVPLDLAAAHFQHTHVLANRASTLARLLVRYTMRSIRAPGEGELRAAQEALEEATASFHAAQRSQTEELSSLLDEDLREMLDTELLELDDEVRSATLLEINDLLREVGLEELDCDLHLGFEQDGSPVLAAVEEPPGTAHVWLLSRLYPRVELALSGDPLLRLERRASRWWFERWSSTLSRTEEWRFTWQVREQEYSLIERETVALEEPILSAFRRQPFFDEVPARQQRLAGMLSQAHTGVFTVREHRGNRLVLEDAADGRRFEVHEHNPEMAYATGFLAVGRLLPFEDDLYLRSPGMPFLQAPSANALKQLAEGLKQAEETVGAGIAIETMLAMLVSRTKVPRRVLAASSPKEAQDLLASFRENMDNRGLLERVSVEDAPEELRQQLAAAEQPEFFQMPLDEPLAEWVQALSDQARAPERRGRASTRKAKQKKGKKKGKR